MEIIRKYNHKTFGEIGTVVLTVPEAGWELDGQALNAEAVRHLATFALQSLQDAYAGAKNAGDAADAFASKYDRIRDGSIGTREGGERNPVRARAIIIASGHAKVTKAGDVFTAVLGKHKITADDSATAKRKVAALAVESNPAYMHLAQSQLDMEKAMPDADDVEIEVDDAEAA